MFLHSLITRELNWTHMSWIFCYTHMCTYHILFYQNIFLTLISNLFAFKHLCGCYQLCTRWVSFITPWRIVGSTIQLSDSTYTSRDRFCDIHTNYCRNLHEKCIFTFSDGSSGTCQLETKHCRNGKSIRLLYIDIKLWKPWESGCARNTNIFRKDMKC